jgi:hypothetical protein
VSDAVVVRLMMTRRMLFAFKIYQMIVYNTNLRFLVILYNNIF